jgi:multidrug efflux pump subunit AcrA (membrane-fusion protein)
VIDLTNIKAPGWAHVVAELTSPAPDDKAYLDRLLRVMVQVSAARQGALFAAERRDGEDPEPRAVSLWPVPTSDPTEATGPALTELIEQSAEVKSAARQAMVSGQAKAFGLDKADPYYDATPGKGTILAIPLSAGVGGAGAAMGGPAGGVITLLLEPRSRDAVRSTLAMAEVLSGYLSGHGARQSLKRTQQASAALDLATRLIAAVNTAPTFQGVCLQLCNDLAKQFGLDRVALGWVRGDQVRIEALSDTEHFDRRMAMVQKLQSAMDECLDQEQAVVFPQPAADKDVLLSQAIVHAHRELAAGDAKLKVVSVPLRIDEDVVGVVTLEGKSDGPVDLAMVELLQASMDLVAPVLRVRRSDDRWLALRAVDSARRGAAWAVGPKHTVWKLVGILAFSTLLFVTFYHTTYRVGAQATLEPRTRRVVSAPMDGLIRELAEGIEPGKRVKAGEVLLQLDDTEWRLSAEDARGKILQAEKQYQAAMKEGDTARGAQYQAQMRGGEAELARYEDRIARARITSPVDGVILAGKIRERIGSTVKLGEALLEIAPLDDMILVARVDERDIALINDAFARGEGTGRIATRTRPTEPFHFTVERIVPAAEAKEGQNTFEVRAKINDGAAWLQPGMEGIAKFDTERWSLLHIGTRRIVDAARMWLW